MATDNFTASDGTSLSTHDANWGTMGGTIFTITSNKASCAAWALREARYTSSTEDLSQAIVNAQNDESAFICVRSSSSAKGYAVCLNIVSAGNFTRLTAFKNGSWFWHATGLSYSTSVDHTVKVTASGTTTVTVKGFVDGTEVVSNNDTSSTITSGNPGFYTGSSDNLKTFDDWTDGAAGVSDLSISVADCMVPNTQLGGN